MYKHFVRFLIVLVPGTVQVASYNNSRARSIFGWHIHPETLSDSDKRCNYYSTVESTVPAKVLTVL